MKYRHILILFLTCFKSCSGQGCFLFWCGDYCTEEQANRLCGQYSSCKYIEGIFSTYDHCWCNIGEWPNCLECNSNSHCRSDQACVCNTCKDPCDGACGRGANCDVTDHQAKCSCPYNTVLDYNNNCVECISDRNCRFDQTCVGNTCKDPCDGVTCGQGAKCDVTQHRAICRCPANTYGDPYQSCNKRSETTVRIDTKFPNKKFTTEDNLEYRFFPVSRGFVQFKVRTPNDAHIALTMGPQESDPMIELILGGWGNTKSVIRCNRTKPDKVEIRTPYILNGDEFRGFWVRWNGGVISAGYKGEVIPFISWVNPEPFPIAYVGFSTGWGATGTWEIEDEAEKWSEETPPKLSTTKIWYPISDFSTQKPTQATEISDEHPKESSKTRATIIISSVTLCAVIILVVIIVLIIKKRRLNISTYSYARQSRVPRQSTSLIINNFYLNLLFRKECQEEIFKLEHIYEEIDYSFVKRYTPSQNNKENSIADSSVTRVIRRPESPDQEVTGSN